MRHRCGWSVLWWWGALVLAGMWIRLFRVSTPPLHGPLLRAGDPDALVVDLVLVVQGVWDVRHGKCPGGWDQGCHSWAPRNVLLGHIPPSLPGILGYHHDVGSPRSPLPCRPFRHPGSTEGGVPQPDRDLWRQEWKGNTAWGVTHERWDEFCIEVVIRDGKWLGWSASWW